MRVQQTPWLQGGMTSLVGLVTSVSTLHYPAHRWDRVPTSQKPVLLCARTPNALSLFLSLYTFSILVTSGLITRHSRCTHPIHTPYSTRLRSIDYAPITPPLASALRHCRLPATLVRVLV